VSGVEAEEPDPEPGEEVAADGAGGRDGDLQGFQTEEEGKTDGSGANRHRQQSGRRTDAKDTFSKRPFGEDGVVDN
jgi:hypothetical protein